MLIDWKDGVFWFRSQKLVISIYAPWRSLLFSERNRYCIPVLSILGWRLFMERTDAEG